MDTNLPQVYTKPLEDRFYSLDAEEREFFKKETGIESDEELKNHLIAVQSKAYSVLFKMYTATIFLLISVL